MVTVANVPTANGGSEDSVLVMNTGGLRVYEQGVAAEIRSGTDPNGSEVDATITFGITPLTQVGSWFYWFDPDPEARTATIPTNGIDAVSTCMHEIGHVLLWNGWRDYSTWQLPSDYASIYDYLSIDDGTTPYFEGEHAMEAYEGSVPQTYNAPVHLGNLDPRPGMDLDLEVMHGTPSRYRTRYEISPLLLAFLADAGLPVRGSEAAEQLCGQSTLLRLQVETGPILGPKPLYVP
jgi:hypothetical protein